VPHSHSTPRRDALDRVSTSSVGPGSWALTAATHKSWVGVIL
jgi:hypothetical protein